MASEELQRALTVERYPRSAAYDQQWVVDNLMGPRPLWSVEALMQVMSLEPGRPGGSIGVIVPGLDLELGATLPPYLADRWVPDLATWDLVGRGFEPDETMLRADDGKLLGLTRVMAEVR